MILSSIKKEKKRQDLQFDNVGLAHCNVKLHTLLKTVDTVQIVAGLILIFES